MAYLEPFLVLAAAVAEGRISPADFSTVCLPLYKNFPDPFPSEEQYQAATDLFYVAHDHDPSGSGSYPGALNDEQVRSAARALVEQIRNLLLGE